MVDGVIRRKVLAARGDMAEGDGGRIAIAGGCGLDDIGAFAQIVGLQADRHLGQIALERLRAGK